MDGRHPDVNEQQFGRVRVLVRCRPLAFHEQQGACDRIEVADNHKSILVRNENVGTAVAGRRFAFDRVFAPAADQADMFEEVIPLVERVLDGWHATVLAYGQTGSGKTYTMDGLNYRGVGGSSREGLEVDVENTPTAQHGIILRAIHYLFDRARARSRNISSDTACTHSQHEDRPSTTSAEGSRSSSVKPADCADGVSEPAATTGDTAEHASTDGEEAVTYSFRCSYYEIYKEQITDLLRSTQPSEARRLRHSKQQQQHRHHSWQKSSCHSEPDKRRMTLTTTSATGLRVRWCRGDTFRVENLFLCECDSASRMQSAFLAGVHQRTMGSHRLNEQSSRSHSIFVIQVQCRGGPTGDDLIRQCDLTFVDLAGSEKLSMLSASPSTTLVQQSIEINTSLFALGKVITALGSSSTLASSSSSTRKLASGHVPYRDSKLTMLLKHALGGNSLTLIIACIATSNTCVEETVNTLLYAGRARNITNVPRVNQGCAAALVRSLHREIRQLQMELEYYRDIALGVLDKRTNEVQQRCGASHALTPGVVTAALAKDDEMVGLHDQASIHQNGCRCRYLNDDRHGDSSNSADKDKTSRSFGNSGNGAMVEQQMGQLADSLLDACGMLTRVMHVNAELQRAYTTIKQSNERAAQREVGLNAENIALRERVAMLETVVLDEDFAYFSPGTKVEGAPVSVLSAAVKDGSAADDASVPCTPTEFHGMCVPTSNRNDVGLGSDVSAAVSATPTAADGHAAADGGKVQPKRADVDTTSHTRKTCHSRSRSRRYERLTEVVQAYTQRYRNPRHVETYAEYYGAARQMRTQSNDCTGDVVRKVEAMLRTMPAQEASALLPRSLHSKRAFGTLAFGGSKEEVSVFEQKRHDREQRLVELRQRQCELQASVRQEFASGGVCSRDDEHGRAVRYARPKTTSVLPTSEAAQRRSQRQHKQHSSSSSSTRRCSVGDVHGYVVCKVQSARQHNPMALAAATYSGSKSARAQSRRAVECFVDGTDSYAASKNVPRENGNESYMTKLMHYLRQ